VDAPLVNGSVTAGPVVFAALGDEERLEYTIIGEAVNLATKIEKHNKVEGTVALTTLAAYERAASQGYRREAHPEILEGREVAGVGEPIDLVVLAR
jgi:adenylate cyclase